jgi:hypothetical protein
MYFMDLEQTPFVSVAKVDLHALFHETFISITLHKITFYNSLLITEEHHLS